MSCKNHFDYGIYLTKFSFEIRKQVLKIKFTQPIRAILLSKLLRPGHQLGMSFRQVVQQFEKVNQWIDKNKNVE